jgi:hypothetical protein
MVDFKVDFVEAQFQIHTTNLSLQKKNCDQDLLIFFFRAEITLGVTLTAENPIPILSSLLHQKTESY